MYTGHNRNCFLLKKKRQKKNKKNKRYCLCSIRYKYENYAKKKTEKPKKNSKTLPYTIMVFIVGIPKIVV